MVTETMMSMLADLQGLHKEMKNCEEHETAKIAEINEKIQAQLKLINKES